MACGRIVLFRFDFEKQGVKYRQKQQRGDGRKEQSAHDRRSHWTEHRIAEQRNHTENGGKRSHHHRPQTTLGADDQSGYEVGIAAAPDFTEELFEKLSPSLQAQLSEKGIASIPNDYSDEPYLYTKALYEDGKQHLLLQSAQSVGHPIRLIHGMKDIDVPASVPKKIQNVYDGDVEIIFIDDGDHRLSRPQDLVVIDQNIQKLLV